MPTSHQIQALELLFNATRGEQWRWESLDNGPKWSFSSPQADPCSDKGRVWQGITCSSLPNICTLQSCEVMSLELNAYNLKGTLPSQFFQLLALTRLSLADNQLIGTLPSEIGSLSHLVVLYLDSNQLIGALPSEIGSLSRLSVLSLAYNQLTGALPSEIGSLSRLIYFYLDNNQLTGALPSEIWSLSRLSVFYLDNNQLIGALPSEIGSLSRLSGLSLAYNQLTGAIPSSFTAMTALVNLHLQRNYLKGPISFSLSAFPRLQHLFLHQNRLTGSLNLLFSCSSSNASLSSLELLYLDVSDNFLSGSIPSTLFLPSRLQSISLSLNCFEDELPRAMCLATSVNVISMDGLGSAKGCRNVVTLPFPFTSVSLVRSLDGSIPECVWSMSNLRALNLAGNGLRGRIGRVSSTSSLVSLTLSHNYLSGKIPLWLQEKSMLHLDLSHNKLTGDATGFKHQESFNSSSLVFEWSNQSLNKNLTLSVNRLSGNLPSSFGKYADLDILSGNLFGCDSLPKNDANIESLSCGSEQYDQSMISMGGVMGMIFFLVVVYHLLCLLFSSFKSKDDQRPMLVKRHGHTGLLLDYLRYSQSDPLHNSLSGPPHSHSSMVSFISLLINLMRSVCVLTTLYLLLSLPVYVLKQLDAESASKGEETKYVTHTHQYNWLWTTAFVSGTTPAIILLAAGFVCLSSFNVMMNRLGLSDEASPKSVTVDEWNFAGVASVWFVFFLNLVVVGTVNVLYVWSTLLDLASDVHLRIQFSFGLFSSLWIVVLRRGLPFQIKESRYGVWLFICLNAMNSVMIPCVVTALSTPSCYQVRVFVFGFPDIADFSRLCLEIARAS
jgi:Leucine-rich repeat (LRR) protein